MTAVVTGASGHVGAALLRLLLEQGKLVRALDVRPPPGRAGAGVEWVPGDVRRAESLTVPFAGAEVVYHLAARISVVGDPRGDVWETNVAGVRNAAEAALRSGVRRFVHCSSVHAFDMEHAGEVVDESSPPAVDSRLPVYDRSKAAGEAELGRVAAAGLDTVVVNPTGIIGPYDYGPSHMGSVFLALQRRRLPAVLAGGFDWVDVRDVADALRVAAERGRSGSRYVVAGHRHSVRELAELAAAITGVPAPRPTVPMWFARWWSPLATPLARLTRHPLLYTADTLHALRVDPVVSSQKAARELDHHPRPIEDTIADLYEWFRQAGMVRRRRNSEEVP